MPGLKRISESHCPPCSCSCFIKLTIGKSAARRFYAQRNCSSFFIPSCQGFALTHLILIVYLTGATLFLSLLLARVFYIILDFIQVQESYTALQAKTAKASGAAGENEELRNRIAELEAKERDFGKLGVEIVQTMRRIC